MTESPDDRPDPGFDWLTFGCTFAIVVLLIAVLLLAVFAFYLFPMMVGGVPF
ncbi:hypothetical protein ACIBF1_10935 [Spirillospora sp. NPDC050679]